LFAGRIFKKAKDTSLSRGTCPENINIVGGCGTDEFNESKLNQELTSYIKSETDKGFDNDLIVDKVQTLIEKQNGACTVAFRHIETARYKLLDFYVGNRSILP
jgi:hypothetical protein